MYEKGVRVTLMNRVGDKIKSITILSGSASTCTPDEIDVLETASCEIHLQLPSFKEGDAVDIPIKLTYIHTKSGITHQDEGRIRGVYQS
jgi:hypothetical protein